MKVYVVSEWYAYEGYSEPLKVFSSRKKAEDYCNEKNGNIITDAQKRWQGCEYNKMEVE